MHLLDLPDAVLVSVLNTLGPVETVRLSLVCSSFLRLATEALGSSCVLHGSATKVLALAQWRAKRTASTAPIESICIDGPLSVAQARALMATAPAVAGLHLLSGSHEEEFGAAAAALLEAWGPSLRHLALSDRVPLRAVCRALAGAAPRLQSLSLSAEPEAVPPLHAALQPAPGPTASGSGGEADPWGRLARLRLALRLEREAGPWAADLEPLLERLAEAPALERLDTCGLFCGAPAPALAALAARLVALDLSFLEGPIGPLVLAGCPRLRSFRLYCGPQAGAPEGLAVPSLEARACPALEELLLAHDRDSGGDLVLSVWLEECPRLRRVRVEGCPLALDGARGTPVEVLEACGGLEWGASAAALAALPLRRLLVGPGPEPRPGPPGGSRRPPRRRPRGPEEAWAEEAGGEVRLAAPCALYARRLAVRGPSLLLHLPRCPAVDLAGVRLEAPAGRLSLLSVACPRATSLRLGGLRAGLVRVTAGAALRDLRLADLDCLTEALLAPLLAAPRHGLTALALARCRPLAALELDGFPALRRLAVSDCPSVRRLRVARCPLLAHLALDSSSVGALSLGPGLPPGLVISPAPAGL
eukprot:tig00021352_g20678.t1